jgi:hypothetical protein
VHVMMFTSWAGDMSPGSPEAPSQEGSLLPRGYDRME